MSQRTLIQVTRVVNGLTYYGFKLAGIINPLETDLLWELTTTVPVGYEPYMMYESNYGQKDSKTGRWAVCTTCQEEFHQNEMVSSGGRFYCTKNGCSKDIT